ncbi:AT-hook motif nuclear-localized protein 4-like [Punica granatum]|uniref:AT-hook motif nuclear-localized protein n=1 Tax=Punica granatum TaxID=22663 RepID=A0A218WAL0_PUNGR|nr:AT-hook motif nuclear-localized protein 4-like [Punica granatum]OWM69529.1 hypothetical protein CDL15_Pgr013990 [Punica granatum]
MAEANAPAHPIGARLAGENVPDNTDPATPEARGNPLEGYYAGDHVASTLAEGTSHDAPDIIPPVTDEAKEQVPYIIVVNANQDVMKAVMTLLEQNNCSGVILSASGLISQAAITNQTSGTIYHRGLFEIVLVRGICDPINGNKVEIMLSNDDAVVVGGMLTGSLIAAQPVQVVLLAQVPA